MPPIILAKHKGVEFMKTDEPHIEFCYPRVNPNATHITVGLCDVRAADDIRISYDFDRDGWMIEQMSMREITDMPGDYEDVGWLEVAFIQAWGLKE